VRIAVRAAGSTLPIRLPERLSFEEGAAFPVNYATAQAGLVAMGGLKRGERVLIHAAAGGVGISATQIAKRVGAEVLGTASASKHDAIRGQGVDHAIDYRRQDFAEEVRGLVTGSPARLDDPSKGCFDLGVGRAGGKFDGAIDAVVIDAVAVHRWPGVQRYSAVDSSRPVAEDQVAAHLASTRK
jgi:threonine dehydrogenase-like Zn-dependent dehydrogenase